MDRAVKAYSAHRKQAKIADTTQPQDVAPSMSASLVVLRPGPSCPPLYRTLALSLAGALVVSAAPARADETAYLSELPVVLSASRLAQPLREAPGALTVLDRDMIRASGARSLAELLRWVPGFQVAAKQGHVPLTTYHGLSDDAPRRMLVRIDGRSAYSPYFVSGIEWHKITVDLEDIERIEVFRGSNAATYGSQAFMGVVNIVTRAAADTPRLRMRVNQGENGIRDRSASIGRQLGGAALRLTLGSDGDDGLARVHDGFRRRRADLRVDWQIAPEHRLEVHGGAVRLDAGTGDASKPEDPPRSVQSDTEFGQVRWRWQPGPGEELSITYFRQEEGLDDAYRLTAASGVGLTGRQFVHIDNGTRVLREDLEFEHTAAPTSALRTVWGLGYRLDRLKAEHLFSRRDALTYRTSRIFGNVEWRAHPRWVFNGGVMAEGGSYSGTLLAPRAAVNYHMTDSHTIRASWSRAHRRSTPFERHSDTRFHLVNGAQSFLLRQTFQPSPDIKPERITVRELGYIGELPRWNLSADLRAFEERIERLARADGQPSPLRPPPLQRANAVDQFFSDGKATIRGAELSMIWRPQRTNWIGLNYTRLAVEADSKAPIDARADANRIIELSVPRVSGSIFAAWAPTPLWELSVTRHYVGRMGWGTKHEATAAPAYYRTDWRVARRFTVGPTRGEFALVVVNGGDRHAEFESQLLTRRQAYASLGVEF